MCADIGASCTKSEQTGHRARALAFRSVLCNMRAYLPIGAQSAHHKRSAGEFREWGKQVVRKVKMHRTRVRAEKKSARAPAMIRTQRVRGHALIRERRRMMQQNPLCVGFPEGVHGVVAVPWTERDHKIPLWRGGEDTPENSQGLCRDCHVRKSAEETKERFSL